MSIAENRGERRMRSLNETMAAPGAPWTAEYLAFVLPLAPEQVLQPVENLAQIGGCTKESRREWTWIHAAQRLADQYGPDEALRRLNGYGR